MFLLYDQMPLVISSDPGQFISKSVKNGTTTGCKLLVSELCCVELGELL